MKIRLAFIVFAPALAFLFSMNSCKDKSGSGNGTNSPELEAHLITPDQGRILVTEYENNNYKIINQLRKSPDAKEIYYDIDVLEEYIQYVKAEAKIKGIPNIGIKVALGQYPADGNFDKRLNQNYLGYQTVFLKPTVKSTQKPTEDSTNNMNDPDSIKPFNFGQLSPPQ